ncbi:MAG: Hpt domain-containing protein, partial [Pyrinomonadaceae bacterium]
MDDQLLREFIAEAEERIESLFSDIERLRRIHASDGRTRRDLVARIFRHVHTLKGSAANIPELGMINQLTHEFENLLDAVRTGRIRLEEATLDTCEDVVDALALALAAAARGDLLPPTPAVSLLKQLRQNAATLRTPADEQTQQLPCAVADALPAEFARTLSAAERHRLTESVAEGARVMLIAVAFDLATLDEHFSRFAALLGECGEIISTFPADLPSAPDQINFRLLYTTAHEEIEARLKPFGANIVWTANETESTDAHLVPAGAQAITTTGANGDESIEPPDESTRTNALPASPVVRVSLRELDELVVATYELFTDTLATLEQALALAHEAQAGATLRQSAAHLWEDFSALEERVLALRMQPLLPVLERAARAARIAARVAGKEIDLKIAGGAVRLDRALAEQIGEPLLHLLRNAIDHGIETTEERRAAGKAERGRVRLEVASEGSRVRLRVSDDGRGVDAERVAEAAAAQGLIEAGAQIDEEQALRLIFRPGFSTAGKVSAVSGRGV